MVGKNELLQVKILEMFDLVKTISESLPKEIGYTWEGSWTASNRPIRFQDALGRNMILPLIFCSTQEVCFWSLRGCPGVHFDDYLAFVKMVVSIRN